MVLLVCHGFLSGGSATPRTPRNPSPYSPTIFKALTTIWSDRSDSNKKVSGDVLKTAGSATTQLPSKVVKVNGEYIDLIAGQRS
jgi:hypothetical protein